MRVKGLSKRNGIYHFRVTVPKDLRLVIGKREIHKSLNTENNRTAIRQCLALSVSIESWFGDLRAGKGSPAQSWAKIDFIEPLPEVKHTSLKPSELLDKYL